MDSGVFDEVGHHQHVFSFELVIVDDKCREDVVLYQVLEKMVATVFLELRLRKIQLQEFALLSILVTLHFFDQVFGQTSHPIVTEWVLRQIQLTDRCPVQDRTKFLNARRSNVILAQVEVEKCNVVNKPVAKSDKASVCQIGRSQV